MRTAPATDGAAGLPGVTESPAPECCLTIGARYYVDVESRLGQRRDTYCQDSDREGREVFKANGGHVSFVSGDMIEVLEVKRIENGHCYSGEYCLIRYTAGNQHLFGSGETSACWVKLEDIEAMKSIFKECQRKNPATTVEDIGEDRGLSY